MQSKQKELIRLRNLLDTELKTSKEEISKLEQDLRKLKQKKSRIEARLAKVNGEIVKCNNGGKDVPVYLCSKRGMI